jgi:hypothetical protein
LIDKLASYGTAGNLLQWIGSFISNRTQQTRVNSALSAINRLTSGVVQGSILRPTLFLLFINDLCNALNNGHIVTKLNADDVKLFTCVQIEGDYSNLQYQLDILTAWSKTWQLHISYSKCNVMVIHQIGNCADPQLHIDNHALDVISEVKDPGVTIDNELKFSKHIYNIVSKANARACLIHKCFLSRDVTTLVRAFTVYVRPLLEYACCVWSPVYANAIQQIESVQRRFTRKIACHFQLHVCTKTCRAQYG